jgi:hypothetical protein
MHTAQQLLNNMDCTQVPLQSVRILTTSAESTVLSHCACVCMTELLVHLAVTFLMHKHTALLIRQVVLPYYCIVLLSIALHVSTVCAYNVRIMQVVELYSSDARC